MRLDVDMTELHGMLGVDRGGGDSVLSAEIFAAKDSQGRVTDVFMSVPCHSGLKQADSLRVDYLSLIAMRDSTVLAVDLPGLTPECHQILTEMSRRGFQLAVAEFTSLGLFDAYFLNLLVAGV